MRIIQVPVNPEKYSSNVYLLLGDFGRLEDINTLIDAGGDPQLLREIRKIYTGAGKRPVDKIILTHTHFDHTAGVKLLKEAYNCRVTGIAKDPLIDDNTCDGAVIRVADTQLQVFHTTLHSADSICLYEWNNKILFSGDTNFNILTSGNTFPEDYLRLLERLIRLGVKTILPGHGKPIHDAQRMLIRSLNIIRDH